MTTEVRESKLAFVDTETTGLDPTRHAPWEVAIIRATHRSDGLLVIEDEWCQQIDLRQWHLPYLMAEDDKGDPPTDRSEWWLYAADAKALEIGGFYERRAPDHELLSVADAAKHVMWLLTGRVFVASNPGFDVAFLSELLDQDRLPVRPWHYRPVCVSTLAAGWLAGRIAERWTWMADAEDEHHALTQPPWSSDKLAEALGAGVPVGHERHTALGDALLAQRLYANVYGLVTTTAADLDRFGAEELLS